MQGRKFTAEILSKSTSQPKKWLTLPCPLTVSGSGVLSLRVQRLDLRGEGEVDHSKDILKASVTQLREFREKPGTGEAQDHSCGNTPNITH